MGLILSDQIRVLFSDGFISVMNQMMTICPAICPAIYVDKPQKPVLKTFHYYDKIQFTAN